MGQTKRSRKKVRAKGRNSLWLVVGFFLLGLALALLLFGNQLFDGSQPQEAAVLEQIPAPRGVSRADIPVPNSGAPLNVGDLAHDFSLSDLEGRQVSLADYRGKPVVVNFWATWCPPCRLEMPEFQRAFEDYEDDELVILAVNEAEHPQAVEAFFYDEMGYTYTPLLDAQGEVGERYGAVGLPSTFFINASGEVTAIHRGALSKEQLDTYLSATIQ